MRHPSALLPATPSILRFLLLTMSLVGAIGASAIGPAFAADEGFHYLAADPSLRAQTQYTNVVMGQAAYVGKVLELNQEWEAPYQLVYPGSVVADPATGQWRMYYELAKKEAGAEEDRFVAMATSDDGVTWTKPELNITGTTYTTDPRNNFVNGSQTWVHAPSVFVDPNAPAEQRYRMTQRASGYGGLLYADTSADGLTWTRSATIDVGAPLDAQNTAFWDPKTQQYIAYGRWWYPAEGDWPARRGVFTKRSNTWEGVEGTWPGEREYTIDPKNIANIVPTNKADIYCPSVVPYKGQYIGLPTMYYHPDDQPDGAIYPSFMYSRDSANWSFEDPYHPMIDLAAHGQNEQTFGMAYAMSSLPEKDGDLYIYYSYFPTQHNTVPGSFAAMHLAKLREDRFVGIESAPGSGGTWTTSEITLSDDPGRLLVNAVVGGSLFVEVLDPLNSMLPFDGYALIDGLSIVPGDYLDALAQWNGAGALNALAGQTVAFRFVMDDATVYSFHFQPTPEPGTLVLFVTGAIGLFLCGWQRRKGWQFNNCHPERSEGSGTDANGGRDPSLRSG